MPQQLLHYPDIRSTLNQVSGEAVSKSVGRNLQPAHFSSFLNDLPDALPRQSSAALI
jgi:hypothetical protein